MIDRNPWDTFLRLMPCPDKPILLSSTFQMTFAQTELSPTPTDIVAPSGTLLGNNLGWLVASAIAVAAVFWIVRILRRPLPAKISGANLPKGSSVAPEVWQADDFSSKEKRPSGKKIKSKKSKKASQVKTLQRIEPTVSVAEVQSKKVGMKTEPAIEPEPLVEPVKVALVPIAPIFEPLQQVGSLRRVSIPESEKGRFSSNDTEKVEVARPLNAPFEKMKKASYRVRLSENRWANFVSEQPAESTAVNKTEPPVRQTNQSPSMPKTNTETISIPPEPVVRAPQGLKGFVSKLKSSNTDADT
jgi:hypothetical protein